MEFKKYQHLERLGTSEVQGIENGQVYVFPKIDGTNSSVWFSDGGLKAGSRNRLLSLESDNAGFYAWVLQQENIFNFLSKNPNLRLFGEWLVPHTLKTYKEESWRNFYVFDVVEEQDTEFRYLPYEEYSLKLKEYGINFIPILKKLLNPTYEDLVSLLTTNTYLISEGIGEGVVIKNYDFINKYGRQTWAKLINSEFKQSHKSSNSNTTEKPLIESEIVEKFVTIALVEKEFSKIEVSNNGFSSKDIPRFLNTVFYELVKEETWNFVKTYKNPTINFSTLKYLTFEKVKSIKSELF